MKVRVKLFALARQLAGRDCVDLELPPRATVAAVRECLAREIPPLAGSLPQMVFAVNADYAPDELEIPAGADVACIPPVSGG